MTTPASSISLKIITIVSMTLLFFSTKVNAESYEAFGNYTLGSARAIGIGGAYTSISDDSNAFFYNPAGVAISDVELQFVADFNRLNNDEHYIDPNASGEAVSSQFALIGGHFKKGPLSLGLGYLMPYFVELQNELLLTRFRSLQIREVGANASYAVDDHWAVGLNAKYSEAIQIEKTDSVTRDMQSNISYIQLGVLYKTERWSTGYSFSPELRWAATSTASSTFLDVTSPQKHVLGASYFIEPKKIRVAMDLVYIKKIKDVIAYESNFNLFQESLKDTDYLFPKFGVEFVLIESEKTTAQLRLGFYEEPSRVTSSLTRRHLSIGFEIRYGPATFQIAQDQADGFTNTSQGISVAIGKF